MTLYSEKCQIVTVFYIAKLNYHFGSTFEMHLLAFSILVACLEKNIVGKISFFVNCEKNRSNYHYHFFEAKEKSNYLFSHN